MSQQPIVDFTVLGRSGLKQFSGQIDEEFHPQLRGKRKNAVYQQMMENDAIIGGILYAIESLVKQATWRFEPASSEPQAGEAKEFMDQVLEDMSHTWDDFLAELLSMLGYGWSYFERVYKYRRGDQQDSSQRSKYDDNKVGWRKLSIRAQTSLDGWEFDEEGGVSGMWQSSPPDYQRIFIPISKSLLFRPTQRLNNPEGRSVLRNAYRSWYFKTRLEEIEAIGMERDLAGLPVMEVPPEIMHPNATAEHKTLRSQIEKWVQDIRRDEREGLVIPSEEIDGKKTGYKFRLVSTSGRRSIDINKTINRYEQRIGMSVLAEFLFLGMDKVGSYNLSDTKTNLFSKSLNSVMDGITSVMNRFAIPDLMRLNAFPEELSPKMVHGEVAAPPLAELSSFLKDMTGVGLITPDEELEATLRDLARLPEKEEEEDRTQL